MNHLKPPHIVVLSSLFPSSVQPGAGLFIRERMFRVARNLPVTVVAPTPWFPLQNLIRRFKPHFRPGAPVHERQSGIDVWFPRFLSVPGAFKKLDGLMMALCALPRLRRLKAAGQLDIIDAHFAYPDGYAASLLSRWLQVPYTITLRGTETRHVADRRFAGLLLQAVSRAARVFSVSESLRQLLIAHGAKAYSHRYRGRTAHEWAAYYARPDASPAALEIAGLVDALKVEPSVWQKDKEIENFENTLRVIEAPGKP